ncbi:MAG: hypothetical protein BWY92_01762 [Firmicutes bacterium ADurb.BinA052]|nr:MAG: hypothetical protein BWY92_01762 [Firmicutes bacterium ADurb.BinA052]
MSDTPSAMNSQVITPPARRSETMAFMFWTSLASVGRSGTAPEADPALLEELRLAFAAMANRITAAPA